MLEQSKPTFQAWELTHQKDLAVLYQEHLRVVVLQSKKFDVGMVDNYQSWARKKGGYPLNS